MRTTRMIGLSVLFMVTLGASQQIAGQRSVGPARNAVRDNHMVSATDVAGIREVIPDKYQKRYDEWKTEFLSTDIGKAPTITLGNHIDQGFPSSVYYPVMNALEPFESSRLISGTTLAAAKLAHEFGHIMKISSTRQELYTLQVQLVPVYNKIFLSNGHNVNDARLVEIAQKIGGNPVEIWEDREYWGEANAMLFLRDRVEKEKFHCRLFAKIKRAVEEYAKNYEERFAEIAKEQGAIYTCGWR